MKAPASVLAVTASISDNGRSVHATNRPDGFLYL
jgi:hypothetical protein